jgi:hypothetical protein
MSLGRASMVGSGAGTGRLGSPEDAEPDRGVQRGVAGLMGFVAATLAVMSFLHLSGLLDDGSDPFDPNHAGIAEAVIALVLFWGAGALLGGAPRSRGLGIAATGFAILGFIVGLTFTIQGGATIDIAYHLAVLPLLLFAAATLLWRADHG